LPGLGDHQNAGIQTMALKKWQKFGLKTHFQTIGWNNSELYKSKLNKILKAIDELPDQQIISLVGASAGASMAINVYAARKSRISAVILICGKINRPQTLGDNYRTKNPVLLDSVTASSKNAD
jgi:predicted peptidase